MSQAPPEPDPSEHTLEEPVSTHDRVPTGQKIAYGMGVISDHHAMLGVAMFALPFFSDAMGIAPTLVGTALMIARLWDAVTDPLVGSISDNWKGTWGRRKPFIFLGAILTGLFFPVLWFMPEAWGEMPKFTYLVASLLVFYTFYSVFSVPYESLGSELTPSYKERTNVFAIRAYVQQFFNAGIPWYFYLATLIGTVVVGVRFISFGIALVIILAGIMPALFCVERYKKVADRQVKEPVLKSLKSIIRNGPLMIVIGTVAIYLLAIMSGSQMAYYINTYYIYDGDVEMGARLGGLDGTIRIAFAVLGAVCVQWLTRHFDKHHLMVGSVVILFVSFALMYFTFLPGRPYLSLATKPLLAFAESGFWILIISMKADVCDWDEFKFGRRREGVISASVNWFVKLSIAAAMLLGTVVLEHVVGYDVSLEGRQPTEVLEHMKLAYVLIPCSALVVVFFLLLKYPLTHHKLREVRAELETRREAV
jgi:GPH family glycoside/pentoside/hexuronide:cation symporter